MKMETCIEVAARVWCDKAFQHVVMDGDAAMKIAKILYFVANSDEARRVNALLEDSTKVQ
jgi:hypothetical protein